VSRLDPVREAKAVASLLHSIRATDGEDDALILDTIEGESGLLEIIDALVLRMQENKAYLAGLDSMISELESRKSRFEQRITADRTLIEQAMILVDLNKLERPGATLFFATRAPKVIVEEEADIPAEFWRAGAPTLDRKAVIAALKDGRAVPGARLDNSPPSLSVRTK
jgi:hypothetical protein